MTMKQVVYRIMRHDEPPIYRFAVYDGGEEPIVSILFEVYILDRETGRAYLFEEERMCIGWIPISCFDKITEINEE